MLIKFEILIERIIGKIEHDVNKMDDDDDEWCIRNGYMSKSNPGLILVSHSNLSKERI